MSCEEVWERGQSTSKEGRKGRKLTFHKGFFSCRAYRSQSAFETAPVAMEMTPFEHQQARTESANKLQSQHEQKMLTFSGPIHLS